MGAFGKLALADGRKNSLANMWSPVTASRTAQYAQRSPLNFLLTVSPIWQIIAADQNILLENFWNLYDDDDTNLRDGHQGSIDDTQWVAFPLPRNSHQLHEVPETFLFPRSHWIHWK